MSPDERKPVREPRQKRSQETRAKLLDAAYRLICSQGFQKTTAHQIAREAGAAVGSFYAYFRDKTDLLHEAAVRYQQEFSRGLEDTMDGLGSEERPFGEALRKVLTVQIELHRRTKEFNRELKALYYQDPFLAELADAQHSRIRGAIAMVLEVRAPAVPPEGRRPLAFLIERVIDATIDEIVFGDGTLGTDALLDAATRLLGPRPQTR